MGLKTHIGKDGECACRSHHITAAIATLLLPITTLHPRSTGMHLEVPLGVTSCFQDNKASPQRPFTVSTPQAIPMKKLYRRGTVHPSPPPPPPLLPDQLLAFLPSAILTLAASLSPEEREVLAYLLSCTGTFSLGNQKTAAQKSADHSPLFNCSCFRCYMSYWVKWDASPNRQLIHQIIDAFEDGLVPINKKNPKSRKERRRKGCSGSDEMKQSDMGSGNDEVGQSQAAAEATVKGNGGGGDSENLCVGGEEGSGSEKGSVRKLVNFLGERIWGVWTH